jgi:mannose-6-phosphate isomerase class I
VGDEPRNWQFNIGNDPWGQLIALEAETFQNLRRIPGGFSDSVETVASWVPRQRSVSRPSERSGFWVRCLSREKRGRSASYLAFVAGHLWLIGPTKAALEALGKCEAWCSARHRKIALLSWHDEHSDGLEELLENASTPEGKRISFQVFSTNLIWNEWCRLHSGSNLEITVVAQEKVEEDLLRTGKDFARSYPEWLKGHAAVLSERELRLSLGYGLRVEMEHVPYSFPTMRMGLRCNHLEIWVDPFRESIDVRFDELWTAMEREIPRSSAARLLLKARFADLQRITAERQTGSESGATATGIYGGAHTELYFSAEEDRFEPRSRNRWETTAACALFEKNNPFWFTDFCTEDDPVEFPVVHTSEPLRITSIALLCGGLELRTAEMLDPSRQLCIQPEEGQEWYCSILEWHLRRIARLSDKAGSDGEQAGPGGDHAAQDPHPQWAPEDERPATALSHIEVIGGSRTSYESKGPFAVETVLIVSSPETEPQIRDIVRHFEEEIPENRRPTIRILPQPLRPVLDESGSPEPAMGDGWSLAPGGHMDALDVVADWLNGGGGAGRPDDVCMIVPFVNLGDVYDLSCEEDDETAPVRSALRKMAEQETPFIVELIAPDSDNLTPIGDDLSRLSKKRDRDGRWILFKSEYADGGDDDQQIDLSKIRISSNIWYVRLADFSKNWPGYSCKIRPIKVKRGSGYVGRRDLDQLTHLFSNVAAVEHSLSTRDVRFCYVRTEDDIRYGKLRELFNKVARKTPLIMPSPAAEEALRQPLLELIPAEMRNVWGGQALRRKMELPAGYNIGEVWYGTHSAGTALVPLGVKDRLPLREALRRLDWGPKDKDSHLPVMVKYLDCEDRLSVQLHPDASTASALWEENKWDLKDKYGKEESFIVLEASQEKYDLCSGFDKDRLHDIAAKITQGLRETSVSNEDDQICKAILFALAGLEEDEPVASGWMWAQSTADWIVKKGLLERSDVVKTVRSPFATSVSDELNFRNALSFRRTQWTAPDGVQREIWLGKEYLIAAMAVIAVIGAIRSRLRISDPQQSISEAAERLFHDVDRSPLLSVFKWEKASRNAWGRIPPGTVHAWLGGGNILIELSDRSDNTFRILDFGRELLWDSRPMHYGEAMRSLATSSLVGNKTRLNQETPENFLSHSRLQAHLDVYSANLAGEAGQASPSSKRWEFLLNPDGPVTLEGSRAGKTGWFRRSIPACRATLIEQGSIGEIRASQRSERILRLSPVHQGSVPLCVFFDTTEFRKTDQIPVDHIMPDGLGGLTEPRSPSEVFENLAENSENLNQPIMVSVPGYLRRDDPDSSVFTIYCSVFKTSASTSDLKRILERKGYKGSITWWNNGIAAALGESAHPLGEFQDGRPGLLLHLSSIGVSAGVYPGDDIIRGWGSSEIPRRFTDPDLVALMAIGRWIIVDEDKRQLHAGLSDGEGLEQIKRTVFTDEQNTSRLSKWLSGQAILERMGSGPPPSSDWGRSKGAGSDGHRRGEVGRESRLSD